MDSTSIIGYWKDRENCESTFNILYATINILKINNKLNIHDDADVKNFHESLYLTTKLKCENNTIPWIQKYNKQLFQIT